MKCPLRSFRGKGTYDQDQSEDLDCLKEECAWWLADVQLCSIKELALETRYIQFRLQELKQ